MDGLEATRRIRAGETGGTRLPIVALTAAAMKEQVDACRAAGMDDVIAKPIDRAKLEAMLERYAPAVGTRTGRHVVKPAKESTGDTAEISIARFHEVSCGDATLAQGLIASFAESGEHALAEIESGIRRGDFAQVRRAAHTLVGASANMGATRLEKVAIAMERSADQADEVTIGQLLDAARRRFDAALAALKAL
jgi:HPt (histidine-containing phosphotransfer) domain-containing protein